jgi:hypothetical protein
MIHSTSFADNHQALRQLVLLNTLLYSQEDIASSIAKQRLIFFVKHVIPWLQDLELSLPLRSEICCALTALLPSMGDIYGEHWGDMLTVLASSWSNTTELEENESGMDRYVSFWSKPPSWPATDAALVPYPSCMLP